MKIKEYVNNLPHKKKYIGIGVFIFLILITFVIKGTHAFYNNESDTIPIVNATIGDFRPVINIMYIDSTVNQPLYTNKTNPNVYITWSNDDITEYCILEGNDCSNYVQLNEIDKINKYVNGIVTLNGDGIKTIYAKIKDKYGRESYIKQSTITLDTTPPTASVETSNITETSVIVKITASDTNGIKQYCLTSTKGTQCNATGSFPIDELAAGTAYNWNYYVEDNAGNKTTNQTVSFTTKSKSAADIVFANAEGQIQSAPVSGDNIRRFQGTNDIVKNNYICIGTSDSTTCTTNQGTYMYRIIGVVVSADNNTLEKVGQLKVIKSGSIGKLSWGFGFVDWDTPCYINERINSESFLTNPAYKLDITIGNSSKTWVNDVIASHKWGFVNLTMLSAEAGNIPEDASGAEFLRYEKGGWDNANYGGYYEAKIGLSYSFEYGLAYRNTGGCTVDWGENYRICKDSWLDQDGPSYTMSYGRRFDGYAYRWNTGLTNYYDDYSGQFDMEFNTRPVFYLSEKIKIDPASTGTIDNPYIITSVSE